MISITKTLVIGFLLSVLVGVWQISAQSATATLSIAVSDEQNAAVPDAVLRIKNEQTSFERTATANEAGKIVFTQLPPSIYLLTIEADGFAVSQTRVVLNVNDQSSLKVRLKIAGVDATVEVTADSLVMESPAVSTVIDRQFIENQPLNGRSFQNLVELSPGVVITPSNLVNPGNFRLTAKNQLKLFNGGWR